MVVVAGPVDLPWPWLLSDVAFDFDFEPLSLIWASLFSTHVSKVVGLEIGNDIGK